MSKPSIPPIDLVQLQQTHEDAWRPSYTQFLRLVKARGLTNGVEVGVGYGGHCESLLDYRGIDTLIGIDPYTHRQDCDDATNLPQHELDRVYHHVLDRMARFGRRFKLIRKSSSIAAKGLETGSLDFVYIDGDHRYESVVGDLAVWLDKVREGGILAGHDYDNPELPGVQQAVDGFFQRLGWPVTHAGDCVWWVEKKAINISYVIAAYNAEGTLWQAAASVMDDNFEAGDELIIIDDGSTDATGRVIEELQHEYPAIRVIRHESNLGAGVARNHGVQEASHDLLFMLDADNVLATETIAPLRRHLIQSNADAACFSQIRLFRDGDEPGQTAWVHRYPTDSATLVQYCAMQDPPGAAGNLLFTRDAWERAGGYPEEAGALDSWGFGLRLVATGSTIGICADGYYDHRIGHDSYWQREHAPGKTDRLALSILRPFFGRLAPASQFYLLHTENQERWFTDLAKRPLRVEGQPRGLKMPPLPKNIAALRDRLARLVTRAA